ncbi:hypothetical protein SAMN06264346_10956 [Chryseobacterium profundimaris]|uniref:Uncharacterized protein n=1 Tax=Chryseobacterium profundimaris TaxID=1387275 RepID=A0ABY1P6C0_9FLAO|nr:hypothetical protein SAMN06264346_10956 [Chryseobacterium profundimaris]
MNAEKKDCLSSMKGHYLGSRKYFSNSTDEIFDIQVYSKPCYVDSLNIQRIKSKSDDYEDRGGR